MPPQRWRHPSPNAQRRCAMRAANHRPAPAPAIRAAYHEPAFPNWRPQPGENGDGAADVGLRSHHRQPCAKAKRDAQCSDHPVARLSAHGGAVAPSRTNQAAAFPDRAAQRDKQLPPRRRTHPADRCGTKRAHRQRAAIAHQPRLSVGARLAELAHHHERSRSVQCR